MSATGHHCPAWGHPHASACNWDAAVAGMNKTGPLSWLILAVLLAALLYFGTALLQGAARSADRG